MTKLELLISQLCPNGVETYKLKEVCSEFIVPMRDKPKKFDGTIPWCRIEDKEGNYFHRSKSNQCVSETTVSQMNLKIFPVGTVICSCSASIGSYAINTQPLITNQTFIGIVCGDKIFNEYLRYYMETQTKRLVALSNKGTIPYISRKKFEELLIPVPPLPVQEEIVRILDELTEKTNKLISELNSELEERKKQYSYYIDSLFDFDETVHCQKLIEFFPFIRNGFVGTVTKHFSDASKGIRYLQGTNVQNGEINDNQCFYITKEFHSKHIKNELKPDDILMVQSGHVGECAIVGEKYAGSNCHALIVMSNGGDCNSMYVVDYFHTTRGKKQLNRITTGGTIKHILASGIKEIAIPFPDIQQQNHIVKQIDSYKVLYGKLIKTISEEIQTRKKQYEYYRDKLLTF